VNFPPDLIAATQATSTVQFGGQFDCQFGGQFGGKFGGYF